jgi:uncharacterized protein YukE
MPDEDVDAVRALAAAYQQLASELRGAGQAAQVVLSQLPGAWTGDAATASTHPTGVLIGDVDLMCQALLEAADGLNRCAAELQEAHDKHGWSWGKALKIGLVTVASAGAVVITVGAAAPEVAAVDAAVIGGEVATAEVAVASATAARTGATIAFSSSARLLAGVRGLGAFLRPQLPWATGLTAFEGSLQWKQDHRLDPKALAASFGMSLVLPGAMARSRAVVRALPLVRNQRIVAAAGSHLAAGGTTAAFDAGRQQVLTGRIDAGHVVRSGVLGTGLSGAGDVVQKVVPRNWRPGASPGIVPGEAAVPRQTLDDALRNGVNLPAHEGPKLGHAMDRHVGKPFSYLQRRLDKGGDLRSSFTDLPTAERAVTDTLRAHRAEVLEFTFGSKEVIDPIRLTFGGALGKVLATDGTRSLGRTCIVVLGKDRQGAFVKSAWLEP